MQRILVLFALLGALLFALGCDPGTKPKGAGNERLKATLENAHAQAELEWQKHLAKASPEVQAASRQLAAADGSAEQLNAVLDGLGKALAQREKQAEPRAAVKLEIDGFGAALGHIDQQHQRGQDARKIEPGLRELKKQTDNEQTRAMFQAVTDLAEIKPSDPNAVAKAGQVIDAGAVVVKKAERPADVPQGDPELNGFATRAQQLADALQKAGKGSQEAARLMREFVEVTGLAKERVGQLMLQGAGWAEKVAGPALGIAGAVGSVAELAKTWDSKSDVEKIAGVAGTMASALNAALPFLSVAAAKYVVPIAMGLALISELLPKIALLDLKLPGGLKLPFGGKGKSKPSDGSDGNGKDKGEGKPGNGKPDPNAKPKPNGKPGPGKSDAVIAAGVAGASPASKGLPPKEAAQKTAGEMGKAFGLNKDQVGKLEKKYEQTLAKNANADPRKKVEELTQATKDAVPEISQKADNLQGQVQHKAEQVRQAAEKHVKDGKKPEDIKEVVAALAAGGNADLKENILITLQGVRTDNLGNLCYHAVLNGWSFDRPSLNRPVKTVLE